MECTLAALVACFSWSGLYLDTGASYQDIGIPRQEWQTRVIERDSVTSTIISLKTIDDPMNPYGWLAAGYEVHVGDLRIALEARHAVSSLRTKSDRGINSISLGVRWYPFRH